jgi:lysophospholipase L1-like esterase
MRLVILHLELIGIPMQKYKENTGDKDRKRWSVLLATALLLLTFALLLTLPLIDAKRRVAAAPPTKRLMVIGNSLDAIDPATGGGLSSFSGTWITKVLPLLGSAWVAPASLNVAVSGVTTSHYLYTQLPVILAAHYQGAYATDVCFVGSPVNDFIIDGSTAQASYNRIRTIIRQLRAAGIQVVTAGCTSCYRQYGMQPIDNIQASITEYNNLLIAASAKADMGYNVLIPWPQDKRIDDYTGQTSIRDGLHFHDDGNRIKAEDAAPVLAAVTNEKYVPPVTEQSVDILKISAP